VPCWGPAEGQGRSRGATGDGSAGATHNPHAIKGHLVVEVLHHVVPPLVSLWVGEVWEGRRTRPDLREGGSNGQNPPSPAPLHPAAPASHPISHHGRYQGVPLQLSGPCSSSLPRGPGLLPTHTFPIRGCPVAFRMNTPRFSPSS